MKLTVPSILLGLSVGAMCCSSRSPAHQAAPVQAAPVQAAPVQAAPVQAAPLQEAPATPPNTSGPEIGGCPIFPPDNPWNRDVSHDPLDPLSASYIENINAHGNDRLHADFGSNPSYGIPFVVVSAEQPSVAVHLTEYPDESDPGPFPIPLDAPVEAGNDRHVLVLQRGTCRLFELYHARREGDHWAAGSSATWDLRGNNLRPNGWTSCDQAGLPVLPGLARYEEAATGAIRHALRVTMSHTQAAWTHPARHPGDVDDDPHAPPMGLRLRLKADYDITSHDGPARVILEALKRYGLIVADTGTSWYISGVHDPRWSRWNLRRLAGVPGTAFEVVRTGELERRPRR